jgi:hypothetical protein
MKVCKSFVFGFFNNKKGKHSEDHQRTDIILHGLFFFFYFYIFLGYGINIFLVK